MNNFTMLYTTMGDAMQGVWLGVTIYLDVASLVLKKVAQWGNRGLGGGGDSDTFEKKSCAKMYIMA